MREPSSLHILYIAPFGLRHKTTVWARTLPLARALVQQGFRCTIVIPPWDSPKDGGLRQNIDGVDLVHVNVEAGLPAIVGRLWREVEMRAPDVVHCVKPRAYAGILQWLLWHNRRRSAGGPRLFLDLDDWEQAWQEVNHYPAPVARLLAWQEEWGIRHADAITVASRWLERRVTEYTPSTPVLYLPNGVDAGLDTWRGSIEEKTLAARIEPRKTVLYFTRFVEVEPAWFAEFVEALLQHVPDARLIVAGSPLHARGDAPFRAVLSPESSSHIAWLGYAPSETLPGVYAASDVAVFPAAPTVLQEAKCSVRLATTLLHGVPVVASAVGEQANYGADGASLLVAADASPQEFARATANLLGDRTERNQMIARAHTHLTAHYRCADLTRSLAGFYRTQAATN